MPLVSFIITVFNCEAYIGRAVESALQQNFTDLEVLVVDDGSTDGTSAILASLSDERLKVFTPGRLGRAKTLNFGLQNARGKYVAILDADDEALPNRVSAQIAFLSSNTNVTLVGSCYRTCIDDRGDRIREDVEPASFKDILRKFKQHGNALFHSSVMYDCQKILSLGGYDTSLECFLDWDLYLRLAKEHVLVNIDERLARKRIHKDQYFGGREGVYSRPGAQHARDVIVERIQALPEC